MLVLQKFETASQAADLSFFAFQILACFSTLHSSYMWNKIKVKMVASPWGMTENTEMQQNEAKHIYQNLSQEFSDQLFVVEVGRSDALRGTCQWWLVSAHPLSKERCAQS